MKTTNSKFKFKGGVHPDYNKDLARDRAIETMPCPAELVISMSQHLGAPAKCLVKPGDYVTRGQLLGEKNGFISVCVRASASGLVKAVEPRPGAAGRRRRPTFNLSPPAARLEDRDEGGTAQAHRRGGNLRHGRCGLSDEREAQSAARQAL